MTFIRTFCIATALMLSINGFSQTIKKDTAAAKLPRYEIGVNATAFFKQFLSFTTKSATDTSATEAPYYLVSKWRLKKGYIRFGVGASINSVNEESRKTADYKIKNNNDYQLRLGYEWQRIFTKRCTAYYGFDILGGLNDKTIHANSGFDFITITDKIWTWGIAPTGGLRYEIFKNVALSTETSIRYRHQSFVQEIRFSKNSDFNEKGVVVKAQKLDFIAPTVVYLTLSF